MSIAFGACSSTKKTQQPPPPSTPPPSPTPSTTTSAPPRVPTGPPPDIVARLIEDALRTDGSVSYNDLIKRLGPPQRVESEPIANTYMPEQIDTLRTLYYTGVEALVYDVSRNSRTFLIRLSLLNNRYATPEGLRVGHSRQRVMQQIGPPTERNEKRGEWIYQESEVTPTALIIKIQNNKIARIDWEFYFS